MHTSSLSGSRYERLELDFRPESRNSEGPLHAASKSSGTFAFRWWTARSALPIAIFPGTERIFRSSSSGPRMANHARSHTPRCSLNAATRSSCSAAGERLDLKGNGYPFRPIVKMASQRSLGSWSTLVRREVGHVRAELHGLCPVGCGSRDARRDRSSGATNYCVGASRDDVCRRALCTTDHGSMDTFGRNSGPRHE